MSEAKSNSTDLGIAKLLGGTLPAPPSSSILAKPSAQRLEAHHNFHPAKSLQSCPTLCDPTDGSPPGSFVHGIFQARVLELVAIAFSKLPS